MQTQTCNNAVTTPDRLFVVVRLAVPRFGFDCMLTLYIGSSNLKKKHVDLQLCKYGRSRVLCLRG